MRTCWKLLLELSAAEQGELEEWLRGGVQAVRAIKQAQVLRRLAEGKSPPEMGDRGADGQGGAGDRVARRLARCARHGMA